MNESPCQKKSLRRLILSASCLFFSAAFMSGSAKAAELSFNTNHKVVEVGDIFEIKLFVNTKEDIVNAFAGTLKYNLAAVEIVGIRDDNSIIKIWIESPRTSDAGVRFSGIIPGGYDSNHGYLFSVFFRAKKIASATFLMEDEEVLLHDGLGTSAEVQLLPLTLSILDKSKKVENLQYKS